MPGTTTRLALPYAQGTDIESAFPATVDAPAKAILDNAAIYNEGTLASRPAAGSVEHGRIYNATDISQLAWTNGSVWQVLGLTYVTSNTNVTALPGQMINCSGGFTVTLPSAASNANAIIGVQTVATNQVTVAGTNIYGLGLSGASSFTVSYGASVILQSSGTNWYIIGGEQDTGWRAVTLGTGISALSGDYTPTARLQGDRVYLRGSIQNTSGGSIAPNVMIFTVPATMVPATTGTYLSITAETGGSSSAMLLVVQSNGAAIISSAGPSLSTNGILALNGVSYSIS